MTEQTNNLIKALASKEDKEKFLSNLEKLRADGSLTPDMFSIMKAEYEQNLSDAILEVERIKKELMKQLELLNLEFEKYQQELTMLDVKQRVGELSIDSYRSSKQKIQNAIAQLNIHRQQLIGLINAKSSSDIIIPAEKLPVLATEALPHAPEVTLASPVVEKREKVRPSKKLPAIIGGIVALGLVLLAVFLLLPREPQQIKPKEIMIPIEVEKASSVGSIYVELVYDSTVLTAMSVDGVVSEENTFIDYNTDNPGRVIVAMISSSGITGDIPIATVRFQLKGGEKPMYTFNLENVALYDANSLKKLSVSTMAGDFTTKDKVFMPPKLVVATPGN
jgi:hypothetical protein